MLDTEQGRDETAPEAQRPPEDKAANAAADAFAFMEQEEVDDEKTAKGQDDGQGLTETLQTTGAATDEQLERQRAGAKTAEKNAEQKETTPEPADEAGKAEEPPVVPPTAAASSVKVTSAAAPADQLDSGAAESEDEEAPANGGGEQAAAEAEAMEVDSLMDLAPRAVGGGDESETSATNAARAVHLEQKDDEQDEKKDDEQDLAEDANMATAAELDADQQRALRQRLEAELDEVQRQQQLLPEAAAQQARAQAVWQRYEQLTEAHSNDLCERLRLVLAASQASRLRGDFRTGKRLNMRKIISYIASEFRKDKIWLRRTKPSKREYQVVVAVDDSKSMALYHSRQMALEALCTLAGALSKLEVGELGVVGFGERPALIHRLGEPFTVASGARCLQQLSFAQKRTAVGEFLGQVAAVLADARAGRSRQPNVAVSQLLFVLSDSDNLYQEGKAVVEAGVRQLRDAGVFVVFVIIDAPEKEHSIFEQKAVSFVDGRVITEEYMDRFRDKNYIVVRNVEALPQLLGDALRQWFEMVASLD